MGDYNYPDINWDTLQATSSISSRFLNVVNDNFLTQHIDRATRESSILDLLFSSIPEMIEDIEISSPVANSDHNIITWKLTYKHHTDASKQKLFNFHKGNYEAINHNLSEIDWEAMMAGMDVEQMWMLIVNKLNDLKEEFVPTRQEQKQKNPQWLKPRLNNAIKKKRKLWKKTTSKSDI